MRRKLVTAGVALEVLLIALLFCCASNATSTAGLESGLQQRQERSLQGMRQLQEAGTDLDTPAGSPPAATCKRVRWFLAVNSGSVVHYDLLFKTAILSALRNAPSLVPTLMYDGEPDDFTAWCDEHKVQVVYHQLSFKQALQDVVDKGVQTAEWLKQYGTYFRLDIPQILEKMHAAEKASVAAATDTSVSSQRRHHNSHRSLAELTQALSSQLSTQASDLSTQVSEAVASWRPGPMLGGGRRSLLALHHINGDTGGSTPAGGAAKSHRHHHKKPPAGPEEASEGGSPGSSVSEQAADAGVRQEPIGSGSGGERLSGGHEGGMAESHAYEGFQPGGGDESGLPLGGGAAAGNGSSTGGSAAAGNVSSTGSTAAAGNVSSTGGGAVAGKESSTDSRHVVSDEIDDEYVIYTDSDVLFLRDFDSCTLPKPRIIALGPQEHKGTLENAGILYINVSALAEHKDALIKFAIEHDWVFGAFDQGLIMDFFYGRLDLLPDAFNWKGYWGPSPEARIVHFHGPKPGRCLECYVMARFDPSVHQTSKKCGPNVCGGTAEAPLAPYENFFKMAPDHGNFYTDLLELMWDLHGWDPAMFA